MLCLSTLYLNITKTYLEAKGTTLSIDLYNFSKNLNLVANYAHIVDQFEGRVIHMWTLIDSQSTVDVFLNSKFLKTSIVSKLP